MGGRLGAAQPRARGQAAEGEEPGDRRVADRERPGGLRALPRARGGGRGRGEAQAQGRGRRHRAGQALQPRLRRGGRRGAGRRPLGQGPVQGPVPLRHETFAQIFDLKELKDQKPDPDTKLHIATVQGMVKRILYPSEAGETPPVDQYDCLVVDECHRGYGLDREMSDAELGFRDLDDYISKYRRILDHFDAVKIGLTATPALHTTEIFGEPTFRYSYREAVIDGCLVDHELPVRIVTELAEREIRWAKGEQVSVFDPGTQQLDLIHLEDEVKIDIDGFNLQRRQPTP
ncbi:DEAD/DEAH box helicase family protein [Sorangium sp. So ce394]